MPAKLPRTARAGALVAPACLAAAAALAFAGAVAPAAAQTPSADGRVHYAVDDARDLPDARPGDGACAAAPPDASCTLRAAFDEAGASGRATTIDVPAGGFALAHGVTPPGASAAYVALDVPAGADIRLEGAGAAATTITALADGSVTRRLHVRVEARGTLAIRGVTLRGGLGTGGLAVSGRLSIVDTAITGCQGDGSVLEVFDGAHLTVTRTAIANNAMAMGLSVWGKATVVSSTIQGNTFSSNIVYTHDAVRIEDSAIVRNRAGTVTGPGGEVTMFQSTVADNVLRQPYGGVTILGGDIVTLEHATVAGNGAPAEAGRLDVVHAHRLSIAASVIADNGTLGTFGAPAAGCVAEVLESKGESVIEQPSCGDPARGDRIVADADLDGLADAGGPTPVRMPRHGSAAIGARATGCPAADVRGAPRPAGGPCAAGAAEPFAPAPASGLLWPLEPSFPTGGPDAPVRVDGVPGPPGVLAVRGRRGIVARGRQAQAIVATGGPVAVDGGLVDLPSEVIDAAIDGTTAWLLHADGILSAVDIADAAHPVRLAVALKRVPPAPDYAETFVRIACPAPGVLWQFGWVHGYRGNPSMGVTVWDVRRPAEPVRLDTGASLGGALGLAWGIDRIVTLRNEVRSLGGFQERSVSVFDAAQLAPRYQGATLLLDGAPKAVALHGHHAFVVVRQRDGGAPDGVLAIDVQDAAKPIALGWWPEAWDDVAAAPDGVLLQRGSLLAVADLADPLRPRIVSQAMWPSPPASLRGTDDAIIARLSDGRDAVVDLTSPAGPRPVNVAADGWSVQAVAGGGEDVAWRANDDAWRAVDPLHPSIERLRLPAAPTSSAPLTATAMAAVADGIAWLAGPDGIVGYPLGDNGGAGSAQPVSTIAERDVAAVSAAGSRLWALGPTRLSRWDVADPSRPTAMRTWSLPAGDDVRGLAADDEGAIVWSGKGSVWRLPPDGAAEPGAALPAPIVQRPPRSIVTSAMDGDRLVVVDGEHVAAYSIDGGAPRDLGALPVPGAGRGLAVAGGRAYVVAGGWLQVVGISGDGAGGDAIRPIVKVPAPGALGPIAIAAGRIFVAASDNGLLAYDVGAPERPALLARCGETWPGERDVAVRAPGAASVVLRLDGRPVAEGAPVATVGVAIGRTGEGARDAIATLRLLLPAGRHRLDAVARLPELPWRFSPPLRLDAAPSLLFDPLGVTFDDGGGAGPRSPTDAAGCATSADGWTVRVDARRAVTVSVPVRADLAATAAVTVTLGGRTARLAPRSDDASVFAGTVDGASGPGGGAGAAEIVMEVATGAERAAWRGRVVREQVWLPWAGR